MHPFQIVFLLNVVNLIGLMLIIIYMSYGMTSLPLGMIRGRSQIHAERASVEEQVTFHTKLKFYHPTHSANGVLDFNILPQIEQL